ncbi:hypothetical protein LSUE1_G001571 [Lachnellula suecica]|uniref:Uncharacterized protein n=1 Tax=Lachnellula suecica TaxID=602035 RepID=A0A8T9CCX0_9HELO|nr:hypothetical protein LSUE1_G001571 [Lachnellula suecica]
MAMTSVQEPVCKEKPVAKNNTGFPEPLCEDRNTTLPHPEAKTDKNATIESHDVIPHRAHMRHISFLNRHHSHQKSKGGELVLEPDKMYANIQYADGSHANGVEAPTEKNGEDATEGSVEDGTLENGAGARDPQGYREGERKKGVLRKLNLHKV